MVHVFHTLTGRRDETFDVITIMLLLLTAVARVRRDGQTAPWRVFRLTRTVSCQRRASGIAVVSVEQPNVDHVRTRLVMKVTRVILSRRDYLPVGKCNEGGSSNATSCQLAPSSRCGETCLREKRVFRLYNTAQRNNSDDKFCVYGSVVCKVVQGVQGVPGEDRR